MTGGGGGFLKKTDLIVAAVIDHVFQAVSGRSSARKDAATHMLTWNHSEFP